MTEKALALSYGEGGVQISSLDELFRFSQAILQSKMAPKSFDTPQKILVAVQYGAELGLSPMQSLQSLSVIGGKPALMQEPAMALVQKSGLLDMRHDKIYGEGDERLCEVELGRQGGQTIIRRFSMADAKRAKLIRSGPWTDYPDRMLYNRAMSLALRDLFPDVLRGIGMAAEVEDYQPRNVTPQSTEVPFTKDTPDPGVKALQASLENIDAYPGTQPSFTQAEEDAHAKDIEEGLQAHSVPARCTEEQINQIDQAFQSKVEQCEDERAAGQLSEKLNTTCHMIPVLAKDFDEIMETISQFQFQPE